MNGAHISDALNLLHDDVIEETEAVRKNKKRPPRWPGWAALAACLCVAVVLLVTNALPKADDAGITAEKITEYSGEPMLGDSTQAYITRRAQELQELMWSPIRDNSEVTALPVYTPKEIPDLAEYADGCADFFARGLSDTLDASVENQGSRDYGWQDGFYRVYSINYPDYEAEVCVTNTYGAVTAQYSLRASGDAVLLDTAVPIDAEKEEIFEAASAVLNVFNAIFDKNFEAQAVDYSIDSEEKWVYVYAWEVGEDPVKQIYSTYLDYVYIIFTSSDASGEGILELSKAWHTVNELEPAFPADTALLGLDEAYEELQNGYIFLGHVCPICLLARNEEVDFSDYDGVEIVYRKDMFFTYNIPYYAFYKQTDAESFAVTYVPAVRVEGLEEYFEAQESWHSSSE